MSLGVGGLRVVGNGSSSDGGDGGREYGKRRQELGATGRSRGEETVVRLYKRIKKINLKER